MHEVIKQTGNTQVKQTKVNKGYQKKGLHKEFANNE